MAYVPSPQAEAEGAPRRLLAGGGGLERQFWMKERTRSAGRPDVVSLNPSVRQRSSASARVLPDISPCPFHCLRSS